MIRRIFAVCVVFCLTSLSGARLYAQAQSSSRQSNAREQAINHLEQLVQTYNIALSDDEENQVITVCRDLQISTIQTLSAEAEPLQKKYQDVSQSIDSTIKFTANALHIMSEDSSNLDLASIHLSDYMEEFNSAMVVYVQSLDDLLVIDCQIFPDLFVAGLEEARFRRKLVLSAAEDIAQFRDVELKSAFDAALERLNEIERSQ